MNVPKCAHALRWLVHQVCADLDRRTAETPLDIGPVSLLAENLTSLVEEVCRRNRDVYEGSRWNRDRDPNEPDRERNLYSYLIGNPPFIPSSPPWMRDCFVIDRLRAFPAEGRRHLLDRLAALKEKIDTFEADDMPQSRAYTARLEVLLNDYDTTADEPWSSFARAQRV